METATIEITTDLQQLGEQSRKERKPILLMFSQDHCPFCHTLKEEVLNPIQLNRDYREKLIMREVMIDPGETLINFNGEKLDAIQVFHDYDMIVTPTIILVDGTGKEIAERQVGVNTVEMYAWYLDIAIGQATDSLSGKR